MSTPQPDSADPTAPPCTTATAPLVVVIDGPAGAGKTTVARRVAAALDLPLLDTGAIYRSLAWKARDKGVDWADEAALAALATAFPIRFEAAVDANSAQAVFVGDELVTHAIRTPEISEGASRVSAHPAVRAGLLDIQRALAAHGCVAEGRDMGTVVFPDASHKFFLTADPEARAARRHAELVAKEGPKAQSLAEVSADLSRRDARDSGREAAPLRQADDALALDSTLLDADAVVAAILARVAAE